MTSDSFNLISRNNIELASKIKISEKEINIENEKRPVITEELNKKRDELYREYVAWKHEV
jgi:hypothetical protein